MFTVYLVVTLITIVANVTIVVADLTGSKFVVQNATEVGISRRWIPLVAVLKGAGAAGLLVGLLGFQMIGVAAATGLVAFFVAAILFHLRARVLYNIAFPGAFLGLALASLALAIRH